MANALPLPLPGFDDLSPEDQVRYVGSLWDRIVADQDRLPVSDAQRALLRERLAAHRADPAAARPWPEVRREIEAALAEPGKRALVHRFPFGVFYVPGSDVEPDVIIAVVDLRQDPEVVRQAYRR